MDNNQQLKRRSAQPDRRERFSIRKFNVGVASVAVAAFYMVGGSTAVAANEVTEATTTEVTTASTEAPAEEEVPAEPAAEAPTAEPAAAEAAPVAETPATEAPAPVAEEASTTEAPVAEEVSAPATEEVKAEEPKAEVAAEAPKTEEKAAEVAPVAEATAPAVSTRVADETAQVVAETPEVPVATTRVAAATYKATYTDVATGEVVYQRNYSVNETTTNAKDEPVTFNVTVESEINTAPALASYKLAEGQESAIAAAIVERGGRRNLVNFNVRKDDQAAAGNNDAETTGVSGFRAANEVTNVDTAKFTVQKAAIAVPDGEKNPVARYEYEILLKDGAYKKGDTLTLRFDELGQQDVDGARLEETLTSNTGIVYATLDKSKTVHHYQNADGRPSYFSQRNDEFTNVEKLANDIQARGYSTSYTYVFNENIESLTNAGFFQKLGGNVLFPRVNTEKNVTARISIDGTPIVEAPYTIAPEPPEPLPGPAEIGSNGSVIVDKNGNIISDNATWIFNTKEQRFEAGTEITLELNDTELSRFVQTGEFVPFKPLAAGGVTAENAIINEHDVILFDKRVQPTLQVTNITDTTLTMRVNEGTLLPGYTYQVTLGNIPNANQQPGADRQFGSNTLGHVVNENGTEILRFNDGRLSIKTPDGDTISSGDERKEAAGVSWTVIRPDGGSFALKPQLDGNVIIRYVEEGTRDALLEADKVIDTDKGLLRDKFATTPPAAATNLNQAVSETNPNSNQFTATEATADNVKTTTVTAPSLILKDGTYYTFTGYRKGDKDFSAAPEGTVSLKQQTIVADYKKAVFSDVVVNYLVEGTNEVLQAASRTDYDKTQKVENISGRPYNVSAVVAPAELVHPTTGITYVRTATNPDNVTGTLADTTTNVNYYYAPKPGGAVKVNYIGISATGEETIKPEETVQPAKTPVGTDYAVTPAQKPDVISYFGTEFLKTETRAGSAPEMGDVAEGEKVITYVYKPINAAKINYVVVDAQGNTVRPLEEATTENEGSVDKPESLRPRLAGQPIALTTAATIKKYTDQGYELVEDGFPAGATYDDTKDNKGNPSQTYVVKLREKLITVTDPKDPQIPAGVTVDKLAEQVIRDITYRYENGPKAGQVAADPVKQVADFVRTATINLVSKDIVSYGDWTVAPGSNATLAAVASPVREAYTAKPTEVPALTVAATDADTAVEVLYTAQNGGAVTVRYIGESASGREEIRPEAVVAAQDTLIGTNYAVTDAQKPNVISYFGTEFLLTKHDETSAPEAGAVDLAPKQVVYIYKPLQVAKIDYKVEGSNTILETATTKDEPDTADRLAGQPIALTTAETIKKYEKLGYELVTDGFPADATYDDLKDNPESPTQAYEVIIKERVVPVTKDNTPGTPVDPTDPNSPVYPTPSEEIVTEKTVTRTITYTYLTPTGETAAATVEQPVTFTRPATVNLVTGKVEFGAWSEDQTVPAVNSPIIQGFLADRATVAEETFTNTDSDKSENVVYNPIGKYIINVPETTPITEVYPNHPTDPTKPGTPTTVAPFVPGYTPTDANGQPLKPVDPTDPTKGYEVPALPENPAVDTPIVYVKDDQKATITFKTDETAKEPNKDLGSVAETGKSAEPISADAYKAKLAELEKAGYEVNPPLKDEFAGDKAFDKDSNLDQTFEVVVKERIVPVPADAKPGQPVEPGNPNSPLWPAGVDTLEKAEEVTRVITYVYEDGTTASATVTETVNFTREAEVNLVTGEIVYGPWTENKTFPAVTSPAIEGFTPGTDVVPAATVAATDRDIDVRVVYTKDGQLATIVFETNTGTQLAIIDEAGKSNEPISEVAYKEKLAELEKAGYQVNPPQSDDFVGGKTFDNDKAVDQDFKVVVAPRIVEVPKDAVPGQPVDPTNPNSPVWPSTVEGLVKEEVVTREITYVNDKGETVSTKVTETLTFTRPATVNLVTGEVVYGDWTSADNMFDTVKSPVVKGYLTDTAEVPGSTANATDPDSAIVVVYKPIGDYIINVPGKDPIVEIYPNDPVDPTKPGTPTTVAPFVPGYTPVDGNGQPLKPVDPTDPTKGFVVPVIPADPSVDTPINYVKDDQKATITFTTDATAKEPNKVLGSVAEAGKSGEPISADAYKAKLAELEKAGYEVNPPLKDEFQGDKAFDMDTAADQTFEVVVKERIVPVTPEAVPGQPVDPTNPNSPVWPEGVDKLVKEETVTREITYVNNLGETVSTKVTETLTFTREANVNLVTGEIVYGEWKTADNMFDTVKSPIVKGYLADTAEVPGSTANATDADSAIVVVYNPIGDYIINVPGKDPIVETYPNHPTDPTKPGTPTTVAPFVPGYTPVDGNGQPLKPVDPTDPTKGYVVPAIPADPAVDTPINYVKDGQKATITFTTDATAKEPNKDLGSIVKEGKSGEPISADEYKAKLAELEKAGYEVNPPLKDEFAGDKAFDMDTVADQTFAVVVKERIVPVPADAKPGQPVDPSNPNSPVWPAGVDTLETVKEVTRTITYVNDKGETVSATVTEKVTFTRPANVNLVTGEITYGEWTSTDNMYDTVVSPNVPGYVADKAQVDGATVNPTDANTSVVVTYTPATVAKNQVIIRYVDTNGNVIKSEVVDTETTMTGLPYDTTDNRPAEIVKDGVRYILVPELTQGQEMGEVVAGITYVTYVYKAVVDTPATPVQPVKPVTPVQPVAPVTPAPVAPVAPVQPVQPVAPAAPAQPAAPQFVEEAAMLPNTGEESSAAALAGSALLMTALGVVGTRRRKED